MAAPQSYPGVCPRCGSSGFSAWGMCATCGFDVSRQSNRVADVEDERSILQERRMTLAMLTLLMTAISLALFALHPLAFMIGLILVLLLLVQLRSVLFKLRQLANQDLQRRSQSTTPPS